MYSTQPFRNEPQSPGFTAETPPQDLDLDQVDTILTTLSEIPQQRRNSPLSLTITKFCLIFKILRFVEYRYLYVASGWMAQGQEIKAACQYIGHLFKKKPKNTRQCLLHAAQLFRIIRSQGQFEPYDSFFLLMATLYIWNYDRFVVSDTPQCLGGGVSQTDAIIRIDQHMSQDLKEKWISGTTETPKLIHISGLGALNGHDSVSRVLRESARILSHDKAWATMAHALKYSLLQMASGATPSFSAEGNNQ